MSWFDPTPVVDHTVQHSKEWHDFRTRHIGASQIPAIMGTCDFRTAKDIFNDKLGIGEKFEGNGATQRGNALEPIILLKFEELKGVRLTNPVQEFPAWTPLSASLDGWIEKERAVVEAKAPAFWKHTQALCGIVPTTYEDQLQAQMLVFAAKFAYYVSYSPDKPEGFDLAVVEVFPDLERQAKILQTAQDFWKMVLSGVWDESFGANR